KPSATMPELRVVAGLCSLSADEPVYLALEQITAPDSATNDSSDPTLNYSDLPKQFAAAEAHRDAIADRVAVKTPDPFINAAASALCVAADAIWDDKQQCFMHGAVAWRTRLLGWRGQYAGDALGWHERTAAHFASFAKQQITTPIPETLPPADEQSNLARSEAALHSNGDLSKKSLRHEPRRGRCLLPSSALDRRLGLRASD